VVDGVFARITTTSTPSTELNYDGIKRDVRKLFMTRRLGLMPYVIASVRLIRDTPVAIMSSDISEADANRIIDQIEGARNNVLQRTETHPAGSATTWKRVKRQAGNKQKKPAKQQHQLPGGCLELRLSPRCARQLQVRSL